MEAIILGGAMNTGSLREADDSPYEAGIKINNQPMIEFVIATLEGMEEIQRIAVVTQEGIIDKSKWPKVEVLPPGKSMLDSLLQAVRYLDSEGFLLVLTSDIPLISQVALQDFLEECSKREADIYYSFVPKEKIEEKYQGVKRTYVRLKDGIFTGGNVVLLKSKVILSYSELVQQAIALRKHPLKLCNMLGPKFLFRLITGRLTIAEIEVRVEQILKLKVAGITSLYPEIGIDVDKPSDLKLVQSILK